MGKLCKRVDIESKDESVDETTTNFEYEIRSASGVDN